MLFKYDGREFDTDKPIYMLGYTIKDSWFPLDMEREKKPYYKLSCKRLYVRTLTFADLNYKTVGGITKVEFWTGRNSLHFFPDTKLGTVIGRSPKECMKLFKERGGIDRYAESRI